MKKIIFMILLVVGIWKLSPTENKSSISELGTQLLSQAKNIIKQEQTHFVCDERQYCRQMKSREEAIFFIENCPNTEIHKDDNGIACADDLRF
ncbi:hypothetical protein JI57_01840 [Psychromonas sp. PRT-SC03]|nr:hypothetical protein JI57_01840 [Psychromonas sp. PRT-SC03]